MKTTSDFKAAWQINKPAFWPIRECSICGALIGYVFHSTDGRVGFDSNCGCITFDSGIAPRSWDDIADHYNCQTNADYIAKMDTFWGFDAKDDTK